MFISILYVAKTLYIRPFLESKWCVFPDKTIADCHC